MSSDKQRLRWRINMGSIGALAVLSASGLINWLLPHGGGNPLRHFFRWIHEGAAILFIVLIIWHLGLHAAYLKQGWQRFGLFGKR
ncbi:MAG: DUF4405 domain-containing protein [Desulfobacterales bacterium]|jgi:hypothetical protein